MEHVLNNGLMRVLAAALSLSLSRTLYQEVPEQSHD